MKRRKQLCHCSFCGKPEDAVRRIIAGPSVYICNECITLCNELLGDGASPLPPTFPDTRRAGKAEFRATPWWRRLFGRQPLVLQTDVDTGL